MKYLTALTFGLCALPLFGQPNTEVFLFDLEADETQVSISNPKNISNNEGYDNQPHFLNNHTLLYSGTRNGQTDIVKYSLQYDSKIWINHTEGSEYSPLQIPGTKSVSSIRLEKDGTQKLYRYFLKNGESEVLIEDIIIGYHVWYDANTLYSAVLEDGGLSLYGTTLDSGDDRKIDHTIGRSLHKIPNSESISYISKQDSLVWEVRRFDHTTGNSESIVATLPNAEDMCWTPQGTILMGKDDTLYAYRPGKDVDWIEVASLKSFGIGNITRLAINPEGNKLALVGEGSLVEKLDPNQLLEPKIENVAWIAGSWKGEALGGIVEEHWSGPSGGTMMATFKLIKKGKVAFYEIEIIRELENSLVLQLKHFNHDLKGWEEKDDTVDFPLKEITVSKVVFEGMTFEKLNDTQMNVYVDIGQKDGTVNTLKFTYTRQ